MAAAHPSGASALDSLGHKAHDDSPTNASEELAELKSGSAAQPVPLVRLSEGERHWLRLREVEEQRQHFFRFFHNVAFAAVVVNLVALYGPVPAEQGRFVLLMLANIALWRFLRASLHERRAALARSLSNATSRGKPSAFATLDFNFKHTRTITGVPEGALAASIVGVDALAAVGSDPSSASARVVPVLGSGVQAHVGKEAGASSGSALDASLGPEAGLAAAAALGKAVLPEEAAAVSVARLPSLGASAAFAGVLPDVRSFGIVLDPKKRYPGSCNVKRLRLGMPELNWRNADGSTFRVRSGPNYSKNGFKKLSLPQMFDCVAIDLYQSDFKMLQPSEQIAIPPPAYFRKMQRLQWRKERRMPPYNSVEFKSGDEPPNHRRVDPLPPELTEEEENEDIRRELAEDEKLDFPYVFIMNTAVPLYDPPNPVWGAARDDGPSASLITYHIINKEGKRQLRDGVPAALLMRRFMLEASEKAAMADRMKGIVRIENIQNSPVPSMLRQYNSKPFLTRPQHKFWKGDFYLEGAADVHIFTYLARSGNKMVRGRFEEMIEDLVYVIESRDEKEMPEQVLGAVRLCNISLLNAVRLFDD